MILIRIRDLSPKGYLAFDLRNILDLIEDINQYYWKVSNLVFTADVDDELEKNSIISSERLKQWANKVTQVIDGKFEAYLKEKNEKIIVIEAVDSSYYEVYSINKKLIEKVREKFKNTEIVDNI